MADQLRTTFSEIADAIRTQSGTTEPISARNFASSILSLNVGGGNGSAKWSFVNGEQVEDSTLPMGLGVRISAEDFSVLASSALHGILMEGAPFLPTQSIVNIMTDEPEISPAGHIHWYPYELVMGIGGWEGPSSVMKEVDYVLTLHHFEESGAAIYALKLRMATTEDNGPAVHLLPCQLVNDNGEFLPEGTFVGLISPTPHFDVIENQPIIIMPLDAAELEERKMIMQSYGWDNMPFGMEDTLSIAYPTSSYSHNIERNETEWFPCIELAQEMESSELANAVYSENENILDFQLEGYQGDSYDDYVRLQFKGKIQNFEYTLIGKPVYVSYDGSLRETSTYALFIESVETATSEDTLPPVIRIEQIEGLTREQTSQCLVTMLYGTHLVTVSPNFSRQVTIYTNGTNSSSATPETTKTDVYFWEGESRFGGGIIAMPTRFKIPMFYINDVWQWYDEELVVTEEDRDMINNYSVTTFFHNDETLMAAPSSKATGQAVHCGFPYNSYYGFTVLNDKFFKERYSIPNLQTTPSRADTNYFNPLKVIVASDNDSPYLNYIRFQEPSDNHANLLQMKTKHHDFLGQDYEWVHNWTAQCGKYVYSFNNATVTDITSLNDLTLSPNIYRLDLETKEITCMQATMPDNLSCETSPVVYDNKIYLFGTRTASSNPVTSSTTLHYNNVIYVYDPVADTFTQSDIVMPEYIVSSQYRDAYVDLVGSVVTFAFNGGPETADTPPSIIKVDLVEKTAKRYTVVENGEPVASLNIYGLINDKAIHYGNDIFEDAPSYKSYKATTQLLKEIVYNEEDSTCTFSYYLDLSFATDRATSIRFYKDTQNGFIYYGYTSAGTYTTGSAKPYLAILGDEHNASFDSSYYRVMATVPLTAPGNVHVYNGKIYVTSNDLKTNMYGKVTSVQSFMDEYSVDSVFGLKVGLDRDEVQAMIDSAIAATLSRE